MAITKSNWTAPAADDAQSFMAASVLASANADTAADAKALDGTLKAAVLRVRGTVAAAGRVPLSSAQGTVPPEAWQHTLVLAVKSLLAGAPTLAEFAAENESWKGMVKDANDWLEKVAKGASVTWPTDPAGAWTARVAYGAGSVEEPADVDMTTDGV